MISEQYSTRRILSVTTAGIALISAAPATAQPTPSAPPPPAAGAAAPNEVDEGAIVVTGSRIVRAGFDQPTPTMVLGDTEIRQAAKPNLQQVLADQPQIRNTVSPAGTIGNTASGTAPVDLRGLGIDRTLTLINGRRFVGNNNLNFVPTNLVQRVELVTGGASAAWGSDAVAGVVNIILNDDLEGISVGGQTGIYSRGDGFRYGFDASYGAHFADGRGHFMIGAEYVNEEGIGLEGRSDRPWYGAAVSPNEDGELELQPNIATLAPITYGGTFLSGPFAGQVFDPDGSLRAYGAGDGLNLYNNLIVQSPLERIASYARLSYDLGGATVWVDAAYGRSDVNQPFFPDAGDVLTFEIAADNAFLSPTMQQQLAASGGSAIIGRFSRDAFVLQFDATRETKEIAVGVEGSLGGGWEYDAHFSHGEVDDKQRFYNSAITGNFLNAVDAVRVGDDIVCRINADGDATNDDPACVPFNFAGDGSPSQGAINYTSGTQMSDSVTKLDSAAVRLQGDPFSLWAGPVTIALGAEARWQERSETIGDLDTAGVFSLPIFNNALEGGFNVKEGFGELLVPLADSEALKLDFNGAARYSDYSLSGGIWSWKLGGTARIFNDVLLRVTRSRDIRAPNINDLFAVNSIFIRPVVDNDSEGRNDPGYDPNPDQVRIFEGGNVDLEPEVSTTWTFGGSISPSFLPGFSMSVDYYDIKIDDAIQALDTQDITAACAAGDQTACDLVVRDDTGTITTVFANAQNIAKFQTNGVDIEASYQMPMSRISNLPGSLRIRALATYVNKLVFETGTNRRQVAGDVGDPVLSGVPKWRATFSLNYQSDTVGLDTRVRYVGGGDFDGSQDIVNNHIDARTYVDLGAQARIMETLTVFGNVNNVFDVDPPLITTTASRHYDNLGRFFTIGARLDF